MCWTRRRGSHGGAGRSGGLNLECKEGGRRRARIDFAIALRLRSLRFPAFQPGSISSCEQCHHSNPQLAPGSQHTSIHRTACYRFPSAFPPALHHVVSRLSYGSREGRQAWSSSHPHRLARQRFGRAGIWLRKLFAAGVEARGIERVPEEERVAKGAMDSMLMWFSVSSLRLSFGELSNDFVRAG